MSRDSRRCRRRARATVFAGRNAIDPDASPRAPEWYNERANLMLNGTRTCNRLPQRSSLLRLIALGLPLVLLCVGAATMGSRALLCLDQVERKLDRSQASEQKYKRLLLNWAPLSAWVGAVASDDDAIEDAAGDDDAMRKAKTLARLRKAF